MWRDADRFVALTRTDEEKAKRRVREVATAAGEGEGGLLRNSLF